MRVRACTSCFPFNYARGKSAREHQTPAKDSTAGVACAGVFRVEPDRRPKFVALAPARPRVCGHGLNAVPHPVQTLTLISHQPRLRGSFLVLARGLCCAQLNGKQEAWPDPPVMPTCAAPATVKRKSRDVVLPRFMPLRTIKPASKNHCMPMSCGKVKRHFRQPGYRPERVNT